MMTKSKICTLRSPFMTFQIIEQMNSKLTHLFIRRESKPKKAKAKEEEISDAESESDEEMDVGTFE